MARTVLKELYFKMDAQLRDIRATSVLTPQQPRILNPAASTKRSRIVAIDLARGIAITLMILSHGIKGLLSFDQMPTWGLVPIHLITKFSSTLFFIVFGIALAVVYVPQSLSSAWPTKRQKLILRGLVILFWYKILTIVEMMNTYPRVDVLNALFYRGFPVYVEILNFYAIALLWIPFALPAWAKLKTTGRIVSLILLTVVGIILNKHFDFWGLDGLKAIFVEHEKYYTWGQLTRGPLVLLGLILGDIVVRTYKYRARRHSLIAAVTLLSIALFITFYLRTSENITSTLFAIAKNEGKHPPELQFMLFSMSGAFLILSVALLGGERLAKVFRPITVIGQNALQSFIFHIFVIFVIYRYLFNYWHNVSYNIALGLTGVLVLLTALWIKGLRWIQARS